MASICQVRKANIYIPPISIVSGGCRLSQIRVQVANQVLHTTVRLCKIFEWGALTPNAPTLDTLMIVPQAFNIYLEQHILLGI